MLPAIIALSKKLIAVTSTQDRPDELQQVITIVKKELADTFPIEVFERNSIPSILVYNRTIRPNPFSIVLNIHLDVVPGKKNQFNPYEKAGRLYGRGSYDMKAAGAVLILLFKEIAQRVPFPLGLQIVTDEEVGSPNSTMYQIEQGLRADFVITGETNSDFTIKNEARGLLWVKFTTNGTTAHGAYPWRGKNAILAMIKIINALSEAFPIPKTEEWKTSVTISGIETNNRVYNAVPDTCTMYADFRFIPGDEERVRGTIKQICKDAVSVSYEQYNAATYIQPSHPYIRKLQESCQTVLGHSVKIAKAMASSDIRLFTSEKGDTGGIEFGPIGGGQHSDAEWVDIRSLEKYYQIVKTFLLTLS